MVLGTVAEPAGINLKYSLDKCACIILKTWCIWFLFNFQMRK